MKKEAAETRQPTNSHIECAQAQEYQGIIDTHFDGARLVRPDGNEWDREVYGIYEQILKDALETLSGPFWEDKLPHNVKLAVLDTGGKPFSPAETERNDVTVIFIPTGFLYWLQHDVQAPVHNAVAVARTYALHELLHPKAYAGHEEEFKADELAVRALIELNEDPLLYIDLLTWIHETYKRSGISHPSPSSRINRITEMLANPFFLIHKPTPIEQPSESILTTLSPQVQEQRMLMSLTSDELWNICQQATTFEEFWRRYIAYCITYPAEQTMTHSQDPQAEVVGYVFLLHQAMMERVFTEKTNKPLFTEKKATVTYHIRSVSELFTSRAWVDMAEYLEQRQSSVVTSEEALVMRQRQNRAIAEILLSLTAEAEHSMEHNPSMHWFIHAKAPREIRKILKFVLGNQTQPDSERVQSNGLETWAKVLDVIHTLEDVDVDMGARVVDQCFVYAIRALMMRGFVDAWNTSVSEGLPFAWRVAHELGKLRAVWNLGQYDRLNQLSDDYYDAAIPGTSQRVIEAERDEANAWRRDNGIIQEDGADRQSPTFFGTPEDMRRISMVIMASFVIQTSWNVGRFDELEEVFCRLASEALGNEDLAHALFNGARFGDWEDYNTILQKMTTEELLCVHNQLIRTLSLPAHIRMAVDSDPLTRGFNRIQRLVSFNPLGGGYGS